MKKLLFFILGLPVLSSAQWTENFDSQGFFVLPSGWQVINNNGPNQQWWISGLGSAQSGTMVAMISAIQGETHDDYLITKAINVQTGISDRISFYVKSMDNYLEDYEVLLSNTDQTAPAFTKVLQPTEKAPKNWIQKTFSLSAYAGQTVYVAVHANGMSQYRLIADTFVVDSATSLSTSETGKDMGIAGISPNPFSEIMEITKVKLVKSVSVSDASGRLVKTIDNPGSELHLGDLKSGLYLVTLNMKDGSKQTVKTIKK